MNDRELYELCVKLREVVKMYSVSDDKHEQSIYDLLVYTKNALNDYLQLKWKKENDEGVKFIKRVLDWIPYEGVKFTLPSAKANGVLYTYITADEKVYKVSDIDGTGLKIEFVRTDKGE